MSARKPDAHRDNSLPLLTINVRSYRLDLWLPTFFHLRNPWQPTFIKYTLHISSATRHNVQLITQLLTCILPYTFDVCVFTVIIQFLFVYP